MSNQSPRKNYCTFGRATLYEILADAEEIDSHEPRTTEYEGLHLIRSETSVVVQPDGYAGALTHLDPSDYDDVLELVADLNTWVAEWWHLQDQSLEDRVEAAGKQMTRDPEQARENENLYTHIPEDAVRREEGDA